nr:alcohol dehydrogenase [Cryptococcus depauperatus CBS 7841]
MTEPNQMRALVVSQPGVREYTLQYKDVPKATGSKVLLRIKASGLCHTDSMILNGSFGGGWPLVGGHEPTGEVVALGNEAKGINVGDRVVALLPRDPCAGKCPDCTIGDWRYCKFIHYGGINVDGYFSEYALVESKFCVHIPNSLKFEQAAPLSCAGVTVYAGIKKAKLKPKDVIAISGVGALGYLGVQMSKAMGLRVVAIDVRPEPLELVRSLPPKLRPDLIIDASQSKTQDEIEKIKTLRPKGYTGWDGVDASILTSPDPSSYPFAANLTRSHGVLVLLAQPPKLEFDYSTFLAKDLTLTGSLHGNEVDLKETVELVVSNKIQSDITCFSIDHHQQMLRAVESDNWKGKAVVVF